MSRYCEVKLLDVMVNKKQQNKQDYTWNENYCTDLDKNFGGGKRVTRSSKPILNVFDMQNFLVQNCEKNIFRTGKHEKTCEKSILKGNAERCSFEIESAKRKTKSSTGNKSEKSLTFSKKSKKDKCLPLAQDLFKEKNTLKEIYCKESKIKKKMRNTQFKSLWENKLTGARRVSKRLTNLKTKNKTLNKPNVNVNTENKSLKIGNKRSSKNKNLIPLEGSNFRTCNVRVGLPPAKISDAFNQLMTGQHSKCGKSSEKQPRVNFNKKLPISFAKKKSTAKKTSRSLKVEFSTESLELHNISELSTSKEGVDKNNCSSTNTVQEPLNDKCSSTTYDIQQDLTSEIVFVNFDKTDPGSETQFMSSEQIDHQIPNRESDDTSLAEVVLLDHIEDIVDDGTDIMVVGIEPVAIELGNNQQGKNEEIISNKSLEEGNMFKNVENEQLNSLVDCINSTSSVPFHASEICVKQLITDKGDDEDKNENRFKNESISRAQVEESVAKMAN